MTQRITEIPRPKAENFRSGRKIYLVPTLLAGPGIPDDLAQMLNRYWDEVRRQVESLERTLNKVTHVYHESVFKPGEEGLRTVESLNPHGHAFVNVLCQSTATLEPTDNQEAFLEASDWRLCLSMGLASERVARIARDSLDDAMRARYSHIATAIDKTLGDDEAGLCILSEDHRVQFPGDIQVFYISPPSLDEIKRWAEEQMRRVVSEASAGGDSGLESRGDKDSDDAGESSTGPSEQQSATAVEAAGEATVASEPEAAEDTQGKGHPEYPY